MATAGSTPFHRKSQHSNLPKHTKFEGLVCVVSGANRGIGLELTRLLIAGGAKVYAGARSPMKATELRELESENHDSLAIRILDVASDDSVLNFRNQVQESGIDLLINNAGIYLDADQSLESLESEMILKSFNVNTVGPARLTQIFLPLLRRSRQARVANISSQMGSIADNTSGGSVAYRMSKTALNMFTKCLAMEETEIISVCLHPGWVQTEMGGKNASVTIEHSAAGLLKVIFEATENESGNFIRFDGKEAPW